MTSKLIASTVVAIAALTGASAFAQNSTVGYGESGYTPVTNFVSQVSRAKVQADYLQARKDGTLIIHGDADIVPTPIVSSVTTRAEVHASAVQAVKAHSSDIVSN